MTGKTISEIRLDNPVEEVTGNELIVLAIGGINVAVPLSYIRQIIRKQDVGLANVDNTSDINKPVSNPQNTRFTTIESAVAERATIAQLQELEEVVDGKLSIISFNDWLATVFATHSHPVDSAAIEAAVSAQLETALDDVVRVGTLSW